VPAAAPQYARWWRHNRGAEPLGFVPAVPLFDLDGPVRAEPGDTLEAKLFISTCYLSREARAKLHVELPTGWQASGDLPDLVTMSPNRYESCRLRLTVPPDAEAGQYLIYAWLHPPFGPAFYDVLHVAVAEEPGAIVEAAITPQAISLKQANPSLRVGVRNLARTRLVADAVLIAPVEAWPLIERSTQALDIAPGGEAAVEYPLRQLCHALEGWLWALAKVAAAGQIVYTEAVRIDL